MTGLIAPSIPYLGIKTVDTLPNAASVYVGTKTIVTDALLPAFLSIVVGGGAVFTSVTSDGTNWRCL